MGGSGGKCVSALLSHCNFSSVGGSDGNSVSLLERQINIFKLGRPSKNRGGKYVSAFHPQYNSTNVDGFPSETSCGNSVRPKPDNSSVVDPICNSYQASMDIGGDSFKPAKASVLSRTFAILSIAISIIYH
jgi:hypothetical protein